MTNNWRYPTAFSSWGKEEREAIIRVNKSNRWTAGPEVEEFENAFALFHNRTHAIMTNSGSSANLVVATAFRYLQRYKGTIGVVPAIAWSTTYAPFAQNGRGFLVSDVDNTWNSPNTYMHQYPGFVVGCSVLGNPCYLSELRRTADGLKIPFLEDNCESLGAMTPEGKLTGTYGDASTFSFFYSHQISAIEGGMILTNDKELANMCRLIVNHGNNGWGEEDFEDKYNFTEMGYNLRGLELHAAIGRAQLYRLNDIIKERRNNFVQFRAEATARRLKIRFPVIQPKAVISPFGIAFEVLGGKTARAKLAKALRSAGIDCRPPTGGSFLRHPYASLWRSPGHRTPNADHLHDTAMFIGLAPFPIPSLLESALKVIKETL